MILLLATGLVSIIQRIISPPKLNINTSIGSELRYGENPHQKATLYITDRSISGAANAELLQGKELSYNNIADADAAYKLIQEFDEPTVAIIKHANPCGVASAGNLAEAYEKALSCDKTSAFGGIIAMNRELDVETARLITDIFTEVIIAPSVSGEAAKIISAKKNLRLLITGEQKSEDNGFEGGFEIKTVLGGLLVQSHDDIVLDENKLQVPTKRKPTDSEMEDLIFAFKMCKHVKSNAIVLVRDKATIGIGAGQMSRLDSSRIAAIKAKDAGLLGEDEKSPVLASDAFFPFADGLISAAELASVTAVIQPGGSIRDEEAIKAADERDIAMVFTGIRHFNH